MLVHLINNKIIKFIVSLNYVSLVSKYVKISWTVARPELKKKKINVILTIILTLREITA